MSEIDPSRFAFYDVPPTFSATIKVEGEIHITVHAKSKEEAKAKVEAELEVGDDYPEVLFNLSEVHDYRVGWVTAIPTRYYLVNRPSNPRPIVAVTRLQPGDEPREPSEDEKNRYAKLGYNCSWDQLQLESPE
jgi:hypothetical protein